MNEKFIYCKDDMIANKLLSCYKLISKSQDGMYVFANIPSKGHFDFSNIDKTKVAFGNKLFF